MGSQCNQNRSPIYIYTENLTATYKTQSVFEQPSPGAPLLGSAKFIYCSCYAASSGDYISTSNAFIFSLRNKEGLAPFKSMVTIPSYAVYRNSVYGPTFGGGRDLYIANNVNSNTKSYTNFGVSFSVPSEVQDKYTILAGTYKFTPDEVEVLYLG